MHNAGYVEYTIENWLKKNKDHLPAANVELLESFEFEPIGQIKVKWLKFSSFLLSLSVQIMSFLQRYVISEMSKITRKLL